MVTRIFLRYTFHDVISSRFRANLTHPTDAALVAPALHINWLEYFRASPTVGFFVIHTLEPEISFN
jgi:hypothetical protein